jgi:hypothetical protein
MTQSHRLAIQKVGFQNPELTFTYLSGLYQWARTAASGQAPSVPQHVEVKIADSPGAKTIRCLDMLTGIFVTLTRIGPADEDLRLLIGMLYTAEVDCGPGGLGVKFWERQPPQSRPQPPQLRP